MRINQLILVPSGVLNASLFALSVVQVVLTGGDLRWLGASIATGSFVVYTATAVFVPATKRTSARLYSVQMPSLLGLLLTAVCTFVWRNIQWQSGYWPLAVALVGYTITFWYIWLYGNYNRTGSPALRLGRHLPEISFETLEGERLTSGSFANSKTLIVFFRANWCTLCMAQLKEIRARADRLASANVRVKFVSNQPVSRSIELARRLDLPAHFEVLFDRDLSAAKALGIEDVGGTPTAMVGFPEDTVMATAIGLDEDNRIMYLNEPKHYRNRPHPDTFLHVFDGQHGPGGEAGRIGAIGQGADDEPSCSLDHLSEQQAEKHKDADVCENC